MSLLGMTVDNRRVESYLLGATESVKHFLARTTVIKVRLAFGRLHVQSHLLGMLLIFAILGANEGLSGYVGSTTRDAAVRLRT